MPTYSELQSLTHYRSKSGVAKLVDKLETRNVVRRDRDGRLIPGYNFLSIPFPGNVQAGFPSPADDGHSDTDRVDLYNFLVRKPNDTFLHLVSGDSMIDAGIYEGDLVISERSDTASNGQIVIAEVNGSCTIKRYRKRSDGVVCLQAENPDHDDIYADEGTDINILAIVRSVIRQFDTKKY